MLKWKPHQSSKKQRQRLITRRRIIECDVEEPTEEGDAAVEMGMAQSGFSEPALLGIGGKARCFVRGNHIYYFAEVTKESIYDLGQCIMDLNEDFLALQRSYPTIEMKAESFHKTINKNALESEISLIGRGEM